MISSIPRHNQGILRAYLEQSCCIMFEHYHRTQNPLVMNIHLSCPAQDYLTGLDGFTRHREGLHTVCSPATSVVLPSVPTELHGNRGRSFTTSLVAR